MKKIILLLIAFPFLYAGLGFSQTKTVSGVVTSSEDSNGLPGVTVKAKGTTIGTITDINGKYLLKVPDQATSIIFSYVGMKTVELAIEGRSEIDVRMEIATVGLDEVVVVGYGQQSKRLLTGSVGSLDKKQIEDQPNAGVDQALEGKIAGVSVTSNSGTPGAGISVRIRGSSSITASNQPLYIVDGVPINTGDFSQQSMGGQNLNALSDINSADIESIQVLKDASYASIYGARAANGVILITTKKGQKGNLKVDFNVYTGLQKMGKKLDLCNSEEYATLLNEALYNSYGISDYFGDPKNQPANTDWQKEVTRTAPISEYQLSVSGGDDKINYYVSGSYFDQTGIVIGSDFKRLSGRVNLEAKASEKLKIGANLSFGRSDIHRIYGDNTIYGPLANALANPPIEPVYNTDGTYYNTYYANPVAMGKEPIHKVIQYRDLFSIYGEYSIFKDLKFKTTVNGDILNLREDSFLPIDVGIAVGSSGSGTSGNSNIYKLVNENTLTYDRKFAENNNITVLGGFSYETNSAFYTRVDAIQFITNSLHYIASAAMVNGGSSSNTNNKLASYFSRINYDYDKKYLLQFILRADGSSRFGANNKYAYFPSASIAWRLSQEDFMKNIPFMSDLKIRGSFGTTGNQEIGNFSALGLWGSGSNYKDLPGLAPLQLENPNLRWEKTTTFEGGLDAGIFNDRVTFGVSVYKKNTTDLLLDRPIPATSGFSVITENIGEVENQGLELSLASVNFKTPSRFNWNTGFNISFNKNIVKKLYADQPLNFGFVNRFEVGQPFGAFYGYIFQGVNPDDGSIKYKDLNGDGSITDADRTIIGNPNPKFDGGLTNTFSFKGFELTGFLQFVYGNKIFNGQKIYSEGFYQDNQTREMLKRWQKPGDITDIPKAMYGASDYGLTSTRFVEDGSFLRLKTITLAYNLPSNLLQKVRISSLRVYVTGQNLFTWTKYSGLDPEANYAGTSNTTIGTDFYTYPVARVITAGVNLGL
jgi:TonB-linked SusC/RagA family outer membrane protein